MMEQRKRSHLSYCLARNPEALGPRYHVTAKTPRAYAAPDSIETGTDVQYIDEYVEIDRSYYNL